jgi:hypothetical protein
VSVDAVALRTYARCPQEQDVGHVKPNSKEILKHDSFIYPRLRHRLCTRRSAISLRKIVIVVSEVLEAGFHHSRLPKIVSDTSCSSNL